MTIASVLGTRSYARAQCAATGVIGYGTAGVLAARRLSGAVHSERLAPPAVVSGR